jgi:hypothetical protein
VSQDDYYTPLLLLHVLKVKANRFTITIGIRIGKGSIASGLKKQLMFRLLLYFYRDIIHWG